MSDRSFIMVIRITGFGSVVKNFINSFYMELMARQPAQPIGFNATQ